MAQSKKLARAPSLRDAHKERTKRALQNAALRLFAAHGFDTTTTEEIAEKAGVSARTFFRYFPTKESVLYVGERAWVESFAEVYCSQPSSLGDVDAICATLVELAVDLDKRPQALRMYARAIASSPTLRGRAQDHRQEDLRQVAEAIAARRGLPRADEASTLLASVGLVTYQRALDAWLAKSDAPLGDVIAEEFSLLAQAFAGRRATPKRRASRP